MGNIRWLPRGAQKLFKTISSSFYRQCTDKNAIQLRNKCNVNVKTLLSECLNETEIETFNKIEAISERLYDVICSIEKQKMKRELLMGEKKKFLKNV